MLDRLKQIPVRLLELWKKYSKKQKIIICSIIAAILLALFLLLLLVGRRQYVYLQKFNDIDTTKIAAEALDTAAIPYRVGSDHLTIEVDKNELTPALFVLTGEDFQTKASFDTEDLFNTSLNTTNAERRQRANLFNRSSMEENIMKMNGVLDASVIYNPDVDTTPSFFNPNKETSCTVYLVTDDNFQVSSAEAIAISVAAALGNPTTDSVVVMDIGRGNLLFNGSEENVYIDSKRQEQEAYILNRQIGFVEQLGFANNFQDVEVGMNLVFDNSQEEIVLKEYLPAEGQEQGLLDHSIEESTSSTTAAPGGVVGTDPNDEETGYYLNDAAGGSSSSERTEMYYKPGERLTTMVKSIGDVISEDSSMNVALTRIRTITDDDFALMPESETMTIDEYLAENRDPRRMELDEEEYYAAFAACSGIPAENITLQAYEKILYIPDEASPTNWDLILKIILAVLIIGLLIFVIFRGMAPVEVTELEPELSVEKLLATTKENQSLDDIDFGEMSETRKLIEKFVEENPEAVANLLRGWLEDDYDL